MTADEVPDGIDATLSQRMRIARDMMEMYRKGMEDMANIVAEAARAVEHRQDPADLLSIARSVGCTAMAGVAAGALAAVDWEEVTLSMLTELLAEHSATTPDPPKD